MSSDDFVHECQPGDLVAVVMNNSWRDKEVYEQEIVFGILVGTFEESDIKGWKVLTRDGVRYFSSVLKPDDSFVPHVISRSR